MIKFLFLTRRDLYNHSIEKKNEEIESSDFPEFKSFKYYNFVCFISTGFHKVLKTKYTKQKTDSIINAVLEKTTQ